VQGSLEGEQNVDQREEVASPRAVAETPFSEESGAETLQTCIEDDKLSGHAEGSRHVYTRSVKNRGYLYMKRKAA
jgi:hypothetical protein